VFGAHPVEIEEGLLGNIPEGDGAPLVSRPELKVSDWCRKNRHEPVADQHRALSRKIHGHCAYDGITGNSVALQEYRRAVMHVWREWSRRRSGGARRKNWAWWTRFFERYPLPPARAIHSTIPSA